MKINTIIAGAFVLVVSLINAGCNNPAAGTDDVDDGRPMLYTVPFDEDDSVETVQILAKTEESDNILLPVNNIDTLNKYKLIVVIDYRVHEVRVQRDYVEGFHIYDIIIEFKPR